MQDGDISFAVKRAIRFLIDSLEHVSLKNEQK